MLSVRLAYDAVGTGPAFVIVHGLFGQARNWHSMARRLSTDYRVYAVDLRNHGQSPWADTNSLTDMVGDLVAFFDDHELEDAVLLGHSLGGKTSMLFALEKPERVSALVVVDIAPAAYSHTYLPQIRAMQSVDLRFVDRRSDVDDVLADVIPDAGERAFLAQNVVATDDGFAWRVNLEVLARSMPDLVGFPDPGERSYDGRALFVRGERSNYIAREHQNVIFELFPQAEFAVISGAGHRVHAERPEAFLKVVTKFLDSSYA